jgi:hypothetical protein
MSGAQVSRVSSKGSRKHQESTGLNRIAVLPEDCIPEDVELVPTIATLAKFTVQAPHDRQGAICFTRFNQESGASLPVVPVSVG